MLQKRNNFIAAIRDTFGIVIGFSILPTLAYFIGWIFVDPIA